MVDDSINIGVLFVGVMPIVLFFVSSMFSFYFASRFSGVRRYFLYDSFCLLVFAAAFFTPFYVGMVDIYITNASWTTKIGFTLACFLEGMLASVFFVRMPNSPYSIVETRKCKEINRNCPGLR